MKDENPIALMKCVKNATEIEGMRNAHVSRIVPFIYVAVSGFTRIAKCSRI